MSGGVDSSITAALLKERGYELIGGTMEILPEYEDNPDYISPSKDAKRVADRLGIPHYTFDLKKEFEKEVIDYFVEEYKNARTPNPCVTCNKKIKFKVLLDKALELGADYVATGHYARIIDGNNGRRLLKKAKDIEKDQTYMLYGLTQFQLQHTLMPLGEYNKAEVREIAFNLGLEVHDKAESQDICFVPDNNYVRFLDEHYSDISKPGPILDTSGKKLGEHKGLHYYTIGQRRGLGIAAGYPLYVVKLDKEKNAVIVGRDEEIYNQALFADNVNWVSIADLKEPLIVKARIRYNSREARATIYPEGQDKVRVVFEEKQRAITLGQSVVFYDDDIVVGGGIVKRVL